MSARAALDAARALFATAATEAPSPSSLWNAAQAVLQAAFSAPNATGHALIGEGRRLQAITLDDAHALVSLMEQAERATPLDVATTPAAVWSALERATEFGEHLERKAVAPPIVTRSDIATVVTPSGITTIAAPPPNAVANAPRTSGKGPPLPPHAAAWQAAAPEARAAAARRRRRRWILAVGALLITGGVAWQVLQRQRAAKAVSYEQGVAEFAQGDYDAAARTLSTYALSHNNDARPLIYMARIERTRGNLGAAKYQLQKAIRLDPQNALAMRELGAALLASGDVQLARPFYVRAVELDPTDRVALGFLACTLHRLGREAESQRFADRAGAGDWTPCLGATIPATPPPNTTR